MSDQDADEKPNRTFPYKLWNLIHSSDVNGLQWSQNGKDVIMEKRVFAKKCLGQPQKFKTRNLLSITKQFNVYGFKQVPHNRVDQVLMYNSPNFKRGRPELLNNFTRRISIPGGCKLRKYSKKRMKTEDGDKPFRKVLGAIGNVPAKTRAQPVRQAAKSRVMLTSSSDENSSSSQESDDTSHQTSQKETASPNETGSPQLYSATPTMKNETETVDTVNEARDNFQYVLQDNMMQVLQLPTGLTSSSSSKQSSPLLDISNRPVRFPPPPRRDPEKVMLNGNCPPTPTHLGLFNPNAFIAAPWNSILEANAAIWLPTEDAENIVKFEHSIHLSEICNML